MLLYTHSMKPLPEYNNQNKRDWDFGKFDCIGQRLLREITVDQGQDFITFWFQEGPEVIYDAEGDCCSRSWIEHVEMPDSVVGRKIVGYDEPDLPTHDGHECDPTVDVNPAGWSLKKLVGEERYREEYCKGHDVLKVYHTRLFLDNGESVTIEYRNDSNGYYGGTLERRTNVRS